MGSDELPFFATEIEALQTNVKDSNGKIRQIELDLVGKEGRRVVLVGECKFRNQKFDKGELVKLMEKVDLLPVHTPRIVLFSLSGFTSEVMDEDILAIDINAMYES